MDCTVYGEVTKLEKISARGVAVTISSSDPKQEIQIVIPATELPPGLMVGRPVTVHLALATK